MTAHKKLAHGDWRKLNLVEQMANIGSEVSRTINWKVKSKNDADLAFYRALELLNLTLADPKNKGRLKEIARVKELFADWYLNAGKYKTSNKEWQSYFLQYAILARN